MSYHYTAKIFSCFALTLFCKIATAQSAADSAAYDDATGKMVNYFYQAVGEQSRLYNGFVYDMPDPSIRNNPYLDDLNKFRAGTIEYDGEVFGNVALIYDIHNDQLVVSLFDHATPMFLVPDKVLGFEVNNRRFVRIVGGSNGVKTGYYEQLYSGRSQVLKKQEKMVTTTTVSGEGRVRSFVPSSEKPGYYVKKDGIYYPVSSQSSVLDLFPVKKKEIKQYIKSRHLDFKDLFELALTSVTTYYDSLTN
jgi:hypothetical protein